MSNMASHGKRKAYKDEVANDDGIVYVTFTIKGQDGRKVFFKVNQDKFLIKAFRKYCQQLNLEYETMHFMLEDYTIKGNRQTPKMLNMENGDEIFAARQQSGGGGATL
ncbi:small ubiquitin-related modifier 1-like [Cicer arietinum]|uniref:Small ubiquitin-related modifier 1-like n=1 Tax=Cicer arietinum TaxID=3827 RepID=A0A1S2YG79_CICAR|nr:small ubiquitin-related modifier 1-like [Cicer arietinum]